MEIGSIPASGFMTTELITATEDQTIQEICKIMSDHDIGCVVVVKRLVEGNKPIGIITERDVVREIGTSDLFLRTEAHTRADEIPTRNYFSKYFN